MAREVEAKILEINERDLTSQLRALDPLSVTAGSVFNWFYKGAPADASIRAIRYRQTSDSTAFSPEFFTNMQPGQITVSFPKENGDFEFSDADFPALTISNVTGARDIFTGMGFLKIGEATYEAPSGCRITITPFENSDEITTAKENLRQSDYVLSLPELTVKKTPVDADTEVKDLDEWSFVTDDAMTLFVLLYAMGLTVKSNDQLERTVYAFSGGVTAHIDNISGIPPFAEIEAPSKEEVLLFAKKLGYTPDQLSSLGIGALRELYRQKSQ